MMKEFTKLLLRCVALLGAFFAVLAEQSWAVDTALPTHPMVAAEQRPARAQEADAGFQALGRSEAPTENRVMKGVPMPAETTASDAIQESVPEPRDWTLLLLPYVWLPNNDLTIATDAYRQSEFTTIEDALRQVDYGGLLFLEFHRGKWAIYSDAMYVRLSSESSEYGLRTRADIRQAMIEVAGVRRFQGPRHGIEFLAGLRYFHMNSDVDVQIAGTFDDSFHWVEPIVGLRHRMRLSERWHYDWRADIGGFGAGSRFTWQLVANIHYDISDSYSFNIGYRHIDIDYRNGVRSYESTMSGPMLGVGFKF